MKVINFFTPVEDCKVFFFLNSRLDFLTYFRRVSIALQCRGLEKKSRKSKMFV